MSSTGIYVHRFNSSSHVYFVTVQKKSYLPGEAEAGYVTRISRTCVTDANFDTYSEVTLECRLGGDNYNLVQGAVTLPAGKKLAEDLGVSEGDQGRSGICAYSLQHIDTLFDQNVHMCFNGPRLDHLCLSHNDLFQLSPQLFVEVCKLDISHNEASALEDL